MYKKLNAEKQGKIMEAHSKKMTLKEAAEHAGVSDATVLRYWGEWGLKANGKRGRFSKKRVGNMFWDPKEFCNYFTSKFKCTPCMEYFSTIQAITEKYGKKEPLPDFIVKELDKNIEFRELRDEILKNIPMDKGTYNELSLSNEEQNRYGKLFA